MILTKGSLGVGLALDGGRGSVFGDRPIVIKRIFEGKLSFIVELMICMIWLEKKRYKFYKYQFFWEKLTEFKFLAYR